MNWKETEQKTKNPNKLACRECGKTHGKLIKMQNKDGTKWYICQHCFKSYRDAD